MRRFFQKLEAFRPTILLVVTALIAVYSTDMPTPVVIQKDTTIAFPCQNRGCSCKNAKDCWSSCGCFTDSEKLAWALARKITPPDWFLAKVNASKAESSTCGTNAPKKCCCCCKATPPKPKTNDVYLNLRQQQGCQGQLNTLKKQIVYLPQPTPPKFSNPGSPAPFNRTIFLVPIALDPPTPPPRRFQVA